MALNRPIVSDRPQVKPTQKSVKDYYAALAAYAEQGVAHESALRSAFQNLLTETGRRFGWTLIPELSAEPTDAPPGRDDVAARAHAQPPNAAPPPRGQRPREREAPAEPLSAGSPPARAAAFMPRSYRIRPDGTFRDDFYIERGYWEAKDTHDDLETEIKKKTARGYPLTNPIFEDTRTAVLYQNNRREMVADLTKPQELADLLNAFISHTEPAHDNFEKAVDEFKQRVPDLARGLVDLIADAHKNNPRFIKAFGDFFDLCKSSLNPNLSAAAVDEMLVQHLLTERLIRTIFDNQDFTRRNVIAAEVEKVIDALVSRSFNRHEYLRQLDRFYLAIEAAAATIGSFAEKQHFLNVVYERFFQGYSVKVADTHGIVYTPQEIVDFMCASVEEVLKTEFGKSLGDKDVHILDPCTGTGNFIVNLIRRIPKRDLPRMYREQLFANEVMLLPYYIAALNIEHAYFEQTGQYEPFEGLCFVDSLDLAESRQADFSFMTEENTARVERQKKAPITVIIGNPPYNVGQLNENDNNKNRKYAVIEQRIRETYAKDSAATNKNALWDAYVKFFRWATDRLKGDGIVCFVSNNSFIDQIAFDGMRKHMLRDFTRLYHVHLEGNVRHNPTLAGTTYNVFGIQVGVGITVAVRSSKHKDRRLYFERVDKFLRRERKLAWLAQHSVITGIEWQSLRPDTRHTWLIPEHGDECSALVPIASRESRSARSTNAQTIFVIYSRGVATCRDDVVYDFDPQKLAPRVRTLVDNYNTEVDRYKRAGGGVNPDDFVKYDKIKWSRDLKQDLKRGHYAAFEDDKLRIALYRPFCQRHLFFDRILNEEVYGLPEVFPTQQTKSENQVIGLTDLGSEKPFMVMVAAMIEDLHLVGAGSSTQCFPFYTYDEDGSNRRENITDWALNLFRDHYADKKITKWDIFHYVYGILHHPGYREKFADNLKRDLPRIPLAAPLDPNRDRKGAAAQHNGVDDAAPSRSRFGSPCSPAASGFWAFRDAGKALAKLHLDYESLKPWPLKWIETPGVPLSYRVEKMKLSKDKKTIVVNDSLALEGIPPEVFAYRLGNRSALDWVIDQYQVSTDKRSGITSDPNRPDDPEYIVRLVGQVVRVSVETVKIVSSLPKSYGGPPTAQSPS